MAKTFDISRVGHVGIQVTNFDRSLEWYTGTLGSDSDRQVAHG